MPEIPIKYLKYIDNTGNVQKAYGITVLKAVYDADGNTLDEILQTYDNKVGDTSSLTTTANTDLVSAINEVDGNVGDLSGLSTTAKTNLVAAVNELNQNMSTFDLINISGADFIGDIGAYTFDRSISQYDFLIIATYTTSGIHIVYHVVAPRITNTDNNLSLPTENGNFYFHFPNDTTLYIDSRPSSMLIMKTAYGVKL